MEIRDQTRIYMEKNACLLLRVVIKLCSLSFYVKGLADLPEPLKRRPVNLGVFIPLPAGLVEIKQGEHGPSHGGWRVRFIQRSVQKRHSCLAWDGPVPGVINNPETPAIAIPLQTTGWPIDLFLALLIHSHLISHTTLTPKSRSLSDVTFPAVSDWHLLLVLIVFKLPQILCAIFIFHISN